MILLTGQRGGEVRHMRREHMKDGWWEMPGLPVESLGWPGTKNAETHRVWLPKTAQELIGSGATGFVFLAPRGGAVGNLDVVMSAACKMAKIEQARPHDLRRTHGTLANRLGFGRAAMNRIQNHREGGIADVYDRHSYEVENKHVMESVANHIMSLVDGTMTGNVVRAKFG